MSDFTVKTNVDLNGIIEQGLFWKQDDTEVRLMRWVVDTREEVIQKALIDLGWTPPK